jgi:SAM-dependent methyltransferase/uncharacterized membrane protein YbhN (UPF0104 family)
MTGPRYRSVAIAAVLVSAGSGYLLCHARSSGTTILQTMRGLSAFGVGFALVLGLIQNALQASRLWILLPGERRLPWWSVLRAFASGQFINSYVPIRAGDIAKIALVKNAAREHLSTGTNGREPTLATLAGGILVADKLVDVTSLLLLIALIASASFQDLSLRSVSLPRFAWWLVPGCAATLAFLVTRPFLSHARKVASAFLQGLSELTKVRSLLLAVTTGAAAWLTETAILMWLSSSVGARLKVSEAITVLVILNFGIALPISFANIGTFEAAVAFGLTRVGLPTAQAVGVAAAHHVIQLGSTVMLAAAFWTYSRARDGAADFRVREIDKDRAIDHYAGLSNRYDQNAGRGVLKFLRARERRAVLGFAHLEGTSTRTMIDVGCGGGYYALAAKRAGLHVTVVDVSPEMVRALEGKTDEAWCCDLESISAERTYDIVICAGVLDFVLNPELAFKNLATLTAPGGRLVVLAPRCGPFGWIYRVEKRWLRIEVNLFSLAWFEAQARKCGLVIGGCVEPLPTNRVLLFHRSSKA